MHTKTWAYEYERVGQISILKVFGYSIYKRVGSVRSIFGFIF